MGRLRQRRLSRPVLNNIEGAGELYRNNRDGTFTNVTSRKWGSTAPIDGFSCWAWDYDNDGWLDIFATCYDRTLDDVVKGLLGQPHSPQSNRLFRNLSGKGFEDKTKEAGLDMVFATMGSNFADFDNDGFLDMYLGTGEPSFATLVPNRMFKNVGGSRFAEITGTTGTGHLQKGHGVACGDWDRDGDVDLFVETGGAVNGDKFHDVLFQNPGQGNHWLTVKLVGKKTNRAAIGARIKVVTAGREAADRPPARLLGQQLRGQSAAADDRPGPGRDGWPFWKSTGRRAERPRSSATSRRTRRSRSPSSPNPTGRSTGSRSRSRNEDWRSEFALFESCSRNSPRTNS